MKITWSLCGFQADMYLSSLVRLFSTGRAVAPRFSFVWRNFHGPRGGNGGFTRTLAESSNRFMVWFRLFGGAEGGKNNNRGLRGGAGSQKSGFDKSRKLVHGTRDKGGAYQGFGGDRAAPKENSQHEILAAEHLTFCREHTINIHVRLKTEILRLQRHRQALGLESRAV